MQLRQFTSRYIGFLQTQVTSYDSLYIRNSRSSRIATRTSCRPTKTSLRWTICPGLRWTNCPVVADVSAASSAPLVLSASPHGGLQRLRRALEPYNDFLARSCIEKDDDRLHR